MEAVVDRIEEEFVILVTDEEYVIEVKKEEIDGNVSEGDVLVKKEKWTKDEIKTLKRLEYIKELTKDMWEN